MKQKTSDIQVPPLLTSKISDLSSQPYTDPEALLQARVLKILKPCLSYWLDEQTLYLTLNLSRPAVTRARLESALRELRDKAYVDFRVDPLSRLTEWRLTPSGHALAQPL